MGRLRAKSDYEDIRSARILQNQTRLASLGLQETISELRSIDSSSKSAKTQLRKRCKKVYGATYLRRSDRLKQTTPNRISLRRSYRLRGKQEKVGGVSEESTASDENSPNSNVYDPAFGICCHFCRQKTLCGEEDCKRCGDLDMDQPCIGKTDCSVCHSSNGVLCRACLKVRYGEELEEVRENKEWMCPQCVEEKGINPHWICNRLRAKSDYEDIRSARILENQARLASLGLHEMISELRSITSSSKSANTQVKKNSKKVYEAMSLRRSDRLKQTTTTTTTNTTPNCISLRRSYRLRGKQGGVSEESTESNENSPSSGGEEIRPANKPLVQVSGLALQLSPECSARRCNSKGRGSVYDPVFGICCHFCRQKTLCGEEDCKRCGDLDVDQPCIGKTDCSVCHSSNGVLCRGCLKVRYGEEMEEVRENKEWMCPHCVERKGILRHWICNSSLCLKKRKMAPTGIAIYRAREMGYKSVAHLLMDELDQCANKRRRR